MSAPAAHADTPTTVNDPATGATAGRAVTVIACGATFLSYLDVAVVNLGFSAVHAEFPVSTSTLTWVVSGYAIAFAASLAAAGRLADQFGHRLLLLAGILGFALTSAACALAPTVGALIAARVAQGVAGALVLPAALGALLSTFAHDPRRSAAAIGAWSATGALAAAVGPSVGALLVDAWGWRSLFSINLPVCAVLGVATLLLLPATRPAGGAHPDWFGVVGLCAGVAGVVAAFTQAHDWGLASMLTIDMGLGGVVVLAGVLLRSHRHPHPALDVRMWARPDFALANAISATLGFGLFAYLLAAPLFLTTVWRLSLLSAAGCVGIGGAATMIAAALVGRHVTPARARWFAASGMALITAGFIALASNVFAHEPAWAVWAMVATALGVGLALAITALSVVCSAAADGENYAATMGLNLTARQIGGALGVAVLASILSDTRFLPTFHQLFMVLAAVCAVGAVGALALRPSTARPAESRTR